MKLISLLFATIALGGCSSAAIKTVDVEGSCTLTGAVFSPTIFDQPPPDTQVYYRYEYTGTKCKVLVVNGEIQ